MVYNKIVEFLFLFNVDYVEVKVKLIKWNFNKF